MPEPKNQKTYFYGTGRRKTAVARVRIFPSGSGKITINEQLIEASQQAYLAPLKLVGKLGNTDLTIIVRGGGVEGQENAISHGIARALISLDEDLRTTLKKSGFLTRDPREKERKKFGFKSARRAPQWSKR